MNARGVRELKKYLLGERLTQRQAIIAKCSDCMVGYADGKNDCQIPECPLYPYQPYQKNVSLPKKHNKPMTIEHRKAFTRGRIARKGINSPTISKTVSTGLKIGE